MPSRTLHDFKTKLAWPELAGRTQQDAGAPRETHDRQKLKVVDLSTLHVLAGSELR